MRLILKAKEGLMAKRVQVTRGGKNYYTTVYVRAGSKKDVSKFDLTKKPEKEKQGVYMRQGKPKYSKGDRVMYQGKKVAVESAGGAKARILTAEGAKVVPIEDIKPVGAATGKGGEEVKLKGAHVRGTVLEIKGFDVDYNGNHIVRLKNQETKKSFSIQTNVNLPTTHKLSSSKTVTGEEMRSIAKEIVGYVKKYGSKKQKAALVEGVEI